MGCCKLGLAVVIILGVVIALKPEPGSALTPTTIQAATTYCCGNRVVGLRLSVHFHKTQSYYCYPRNYWWFYRPYTTALDGHARCMPYFHYLEPYDGRGAKPDRYIK